MMVFGNFKLIEKKDDDVNIDIDIESTSAEEQHPFKDFIKFVINYIREFWKFARIPFLIMVIICLIITIIGIVKPPKLSMRNSLVASHGATESAFLGYTFTPELIKEIDEGNIDLYGLYVCNEGNSLGITFEESDDAIPGTASKIKVTKIEYIIYSEEYMEKYFSPEYIEEIKARDEIPGYWNYTIDLK